MKCLFPIRIKYKDYLGYDRYLDAPCGKCVCCAKRRQNDWSIRLYEESKDWLHMDFVTFTYNDSSLPTVTDIDYLTGELLCLSTLRMKDLSDAIKRFRTRYYRQYGEVLELKYFACSEYGSRGSLRPHYHCLFFYSCDPVRMKALYNDWRLSFGFVMDKTVGLMSSDKQKVSIYVSKYLTKGFFCSRRDDIEAGLIEAPRYVMSKGIGKGYVDRMYDYHRNCDVHTMVDRMFYSFGDKFRYSLPRYYKDHFYHKFTKDYTVDYEYTFENLRQVATVGSTKSVSRFTSRNLLSFTIADIVRKRHIVDFYRKIRINVPSTETRITPLRLSTYVMAQNFESKRQIRDTWLSMAKFANKSHFSLHSSS